LTKLIRPRILGTQKRIVLCAERERRHPAGGRTHPPLGIHERQGDSSWINPPAEQEPSLRDVNMSAGRPPVPRRRVSCPAGPSIPFLANCFWWGRERRGPVQVRTRSRPRD